jgi:hypothetical protein
VKISGSDIHKHHTIQGVNQMNLFYPKISLCFLSKLEEEDFVILFNDYGFAEQVDFTFCASMSLVLPWN